MATIAIYSMKGGVGKTTLAVNLAWAAATLSSRRTLLWDLDAQAAASFILAPDRPAGDEARAVLKGDIGPTKTIVATGIERLDLLPANASLRGLDALFADIDRKKRVRRLGQALNARYDHVLLDCPPGLGTTAEQTIRSADLILMPMIPSALSQRAYAEVRQHLDQAHKGGPRLLPLFNMVDRRRSAHRQALSNDPDWPAIPMASVVETMAERRAPLGAYAPRSPAASAIAGLWTEIERRLAA
jgi:chromosome partitioning protein